MKKQVDECDRYRKLINLAISWIENEEILLEIYYFIESFVAEEKNPDEVIDIERIRKLIGEYQKWWSVNGKSLIQNPPIFIPTLEELGWHRTKRFYELREANKTIE